MTIFVNFTALPSIAHIFDWDIITLNISEEEMKNNLTDFNEKLLPKPYKIQDYIQEKINFKSVDNIFIQKDITIHINPYISTLSPPPEV